MRGDAVLERDDGGRLGASNAVVSSPDGDLGRFDGAAETVAARAWVSSPAAVVALVFCVTYAVIASMLLVIGVLLTRPVVLVDRTASIDHAVADWFAGIRVDAVDGLARAVSWTTSTVAVVAVMLAVGGALVMRRRWAMLAVLVSGVALELAVFATVSFAVARPRPDVALGDLPVTASFPSGHAAMAVVLWGALAVAVRRETDDERLATASVVAAAGLAAAVGVARLYAGLHYLTDVLLGWLLGAAALTVAMIIGRLVRLARSDRWPAARDEPSRRRTVGRVATVLAAIGMALLVWGFAIEPRFVLEVQDLDADVPSLAPEWEGRRIGVVSDLQVGMWLDNVGMASEAVEELVDARPDAALILGDFVYGEGHTERAVGTAVEIVAALPAAGIPTYAVLGNHDYDAGAADLLVEELREVGIQVLRNEAVPLAAPDGGDPVWIVGIGPERPGRAAPEQALASVPPEAPRIVMMHNPATFDDLPAGAAPLALAGHTHGGQIRLPFLPEWSLLRLVANNPVHTDGWIADDYGAPGNRLFVNRGIGMSILPMRINCPPVVSIFELHAEGER